MFAGSAKIGVKYLWHDAPPVMLPDQNYMVHLRVQNTGLSGWGTSAGMVPVSFTYEWKRDGSVVASGAATAIRASVINGENVTLMLPVATSVSQGGGLAEGDYTLEWRPTEAGKKGDGGETGTH